MEGKHAWVVERFTDAHDADVQAMEDLKGMHNEVLTTLHNEVLKTMHTEVLKTMHTEVLKTMHKHGEGN